MRGDRLAVWLNTIGYRASDLVAFARRLERWGYGTLWINDGMARDPMVIAARILADTERLQVALGVANIYSRDPTTMLGAQYGLIEQWDGRFPLGMGVSHSPVAHGVYGWGFCRWRIGRAADTMLAWGDETAIRKLIQQYWDAGANQVALQVMPKGEGL